jgi:hypothetical protein
MSSREQLAVRQSKQEIATGEIGVRGQFAVQKFLTGYVGYEVKNGGNRRARIRSALPQSSDVGGARWHGGFVPIAVISGSDKIPQYRIF